MKDRIPNAERRTPNAERRIPNTEHRTPNTERRTPNTECRTVEGKERGDTTTYTHDCDGNVTAETDPGTSMAVTGGSWTAGTAQLTFAANAKPSVQGTIVVSGVSPSGYDGTFTVTGSPSTSVTYSLGTNPGGSASGGAIQYRP